MIWYVVHVSAVRVRDIIFWYDFNLDWVWVEGTLQTYEKRKLMYNLDETLLQFSPFVERIWLAGQQKQYYWKCVGGPGQRLQSLGPSIENYKNLK